MPMNLSTTRVLHQSKSSEIYAVDFDYYASEIYWMDIANVIASLYIITYLFVV